MNNGLTGERFTCYTIQFVLYANPTGGAAAPAAARWRPSSADNWFKSGDYVNLPPGHFTVEFKNVSGWTKPASRIYPVLNNVTYSARYTHGQRNVTADRERNREAAAPSKFFDLLFWHKF